MKREPKNIAASIQARLLQRSGELNVEHQLTLARFGGERLLYRLSKSEFLDRFILKGAALLLLWMGDATRPTKDVDLLGLGDTSAEALNKIFVALCKVEAPDDGLTFMSDTVRVQAIREGQEYGGMRITLMAMLGNVRIPLQVDVGAGDAVVPPPDTIDYPGLLDLPRARLRVYRPETSIAEKTEAMVRLAMANSRMKDFFDIHGLATTRPFDGETLRLALTATFERRQTPLPSEMPLALTQEFGDDRQKGRQWASFVGRIRGADHTDLSEVIDVLCAFLWPALQAAAKGERWPHQWKSGGPWTSA
ncbi:MAG: nucleotidyl transferase AbiEii/AbiGii toxin family protein [Vicinamibacterales bacterium]